MDDLAPMTIAIEGELATSIREAVADGAFESPEQLVRAALRDWREARAIDGDREAIRRAVEAGRMSAGRMSAGRTSGGQDR